MTKVRKPVAGRSLSTGMKRLVASESQRRDGTGWHWYQFAHAGEPGNDGKGQHKNCRFHNGSLQAVPDLTYGA